MKEHPTFVSCSPKTPEFISDYQGLLQLRFKYFAKPWAYCFRAFDKASGRKLVACLFSLLDGSVEAKLEYTWSTACLIVQTWNQQSSVDFGINRWNGHLLTQSDLTLLLLLDNFLVIYKMMQNSWKITETLAFGYSTKITQWELSNEYQHARQGLDGFQKPSRPWALDGSSLFALEVLS